MKRVVYARRGGLEAIEIIDEKNPTPEDNQVRIEDLYALMNPLIKYHILYIYLKYLFNLIFLPGGLMLHD